MRLKTTFSLIIGLGASAPGWAGQQLERRAGASLALPAAPADLSRAEDRDEFYRNLRATLNTNTVTVQSQKNFDEETLNRTLRQMESNAESSRDPSMVTLQSAWAELQDVLAKAAPPEEFAADDAPPPAAPSKALVKQLVGWVKRTKVVELPPTFVKWSEIFTANEPRVRSAVEGVNAVIAQIENDRDKMAFEVGDLLVLLDTLTAQIADYDAKAKELEARLATADLAEDERSFIQNTLLYELNKDLTRLVGEKRLYTGQLGKRQQYLALADPVLAEVKANAVLALPAMQAAALIASCAYKLERASEISKRFAETYRAADNVASEALQRTAEKLKNSGQSQLMTDAHWTRQEAAREKTQAVIAEIENQGRGNVQAELAALRIVSEKVAATGRTIMTNLDRQIRQIDQTRALPPGR